MSQLTLAELERHLWGAADLLRGSIDSGDFKHYIFGLLFYKRLCDVWEEEYEQRLAEYGDAERAADPEEHRFDVPEGCFWKTLGETMPQWAKSKELLEQWEGAHRAV